MRIKIFFIKFSNGTPKHIIFRNRILPLNFKSKETEFDKMINYIVGNVFDSRDDVLVHGCNCFTQFQSTSAVSQRFT